MSWDLNNSQKQVLLLGGKWSELTTEIVTPGVGSKMGFKLQYQGR